MAPWNEDEMPREDWWLIRLTPSEDWWLEAFTVMAAAFARQGNITVLLCCCCGRRWRSIWSKYFISNPLLFQKQNSGECLSNIHVYVVALYLVSDYKSQGNLQANNNTIFVHADKMQRFGGKQYKKQ